MKIRNKGNQGFTMIELLMVIMLVAILGAVALPQFLDFRTEGRVAATQSLVSSIRSGIKLQYSQAILRCGVANGTWPTTATISNNDVTSDSANYGCTTGEITNASERRFVDSDNFPENPFNNLSAVADCDESTTNQCTEAQAQNAGAATTDTSDDTIGWCYNEATGNFWAATDIRSECDF